MSTTRPIIKGIFLDDERMPVDAFWMTYPYEIEWTIVRTMEQFVKAITAQVVSGSVFSFDHDLQDFDAQGDESTGMSCIRYLGDFCMDNGLGMPECFFHTQNGIGRDNMAGYYEQAKTHILPSAGTHQK